MADLPDAVRDELRAQMTAMQQLAHAGHVDEASAACTHILGRVEELQAAHGESPELDDLRAAMLTNIADLAEQRGDWGRAESAWRDALPILAGLATRFLELPRYRQLFAQANYRLGELYLINYQPAKAEPPLREAIVAWESVDATSLHVARAHGKLADAERQLRRATDALRDYRRSQTLFEALIDSDPDAAEELIHVRRQIGGVYRDLKAPTEAIHEIEAAAALERRHPIAPDRRSGLFADLATVYQAGGRPDGAEEALRRSVALVGTPTNDWFDRGRTVGLLNRLGVLYLDTGRLAHAERTFALAVERGEGHTATDLATPVHRAAAAFNRLRVLKLFGREADLDAATGRVLTLLQVAETAFPDEPAVESIRESIMAEINQPISPKLPELSAAFLTWRLPGPPPLRRDHGTVPAALAEPFGRARELVAEGRPDEAIQVLAETLQINRALPVQYDLIDLLRATGREDVALRAIDPLLREQPRYADGWYLRGLILGRFLDDAGGPAEPLDFARHEAAIDAFDESILLEPEEPEFRLWKGRALFRLAHAMLARNQAVADACRKAKMEVPEWPADEARCAVDRAKESFTVAAKLAPTDAEPPFALGALLVALEPESADEAKAAFRAALAIRPDFAAAREELARIETAGG